MEKFMEKGYKTFSKMLSEEAFDKQINYLEKEEIRNFLRASLMYQRAMECRPCDSDVCMTLLCSAVEVVSSATSYSKIAKVYR